MGAINTFEGSLLFSVTITPPAGAAVGSVKSKGVAAFGIALSPAPDLREVNFADVHAVNRLVGNQPASNPPSP